VLFLPAGCLNLSPDTYRPVSEYAHSMAIYQRPSERSPEDGLARADVSAASAQPPIDPQADGITPRVLTLEEARGIAVAANPDVHAAIARLEAARDRVLEAASLFHPNVVLTHNSARTFLTPASRNRLNTLLQPTPVVPTNLDAAQNVAVTALLNAIRTPLFGAPDPGGLGRSFSEHSSALTLTWSIFDGFVRDARLLSAKYLRDASAHELDDVRRLLMHAVDTAYYQVQLAQERIRIALADEAFGRQQLEVTRKLMEADRSSRADVENFEIRVLAAQSAVTAAQGLRDSGRVVLGELLAMPGAALPDELALSPLMEETAEEMAAPEPGAWIDHALRNRPDFIRSRALLASQEQLVRASRGAYSPTLALSSSWGYDHGSNFRYSKEDQSAAAAMELRWELYTGGGRRARLLAARHRQTEAEAIAQRLRLSIQSETRQSIIDLTDAQQQIHLRDETLRTALAARRRVEAAYLAGKENLVRLNEAQRDVITADADLALARIRLRQAWSDLAAAAATYGEVPLPEPDPRDPG
jgi:outer membrane protein TolC